MQCASVLTWQQGSRCRECSGTQSLINQFQFVTWRFFKKSSPSLILKFQPPSIFSPLSSIPSHPCCASRTMLEEQICGLHSSLQCIVTPIPHCITPCQPACPDNNGCTKRWEILLACPPWTATRNIQILSDCIDPSTLLKCYQHQSCWNKHQNYFYDPWDPIFGEFRLY